MVLVAEGILSQSAPTCNLLVAPKGLSRYPGHAGGRPPNEAGGQLGSLPDGGERTAKGNGFTSQNPTWRSVVQITGSIAVVLSHLQGP